MSNKVCIPVIVRGSSQAHPATGTAHRHHGRTLRVVAVPGSGGARHPHTTAGADRQRLWQHAVLRLGYGSSVAPTPRRDLEDVVTGQPPL